MASVFTLLISYIAPFFLVTSPITSYGDQIRSIHQRRSSAGFSLDIPLIMLISSVLRCFYFLGARFELSLLYQSLLMIIVQVILLRVALQHRPATPPPLPFTPVGHSSGRPFDFWQWSSQKPYWHFLLAFVLTVTTLQLLLGWSERFVSLIGAVGLGIEATLPLPQLLKNWRERGCRGFRVSVLIAWLLGDVMKMVFFFNAKSVGTMFKVCAGVQMMLDFALGGQFLLFGEGEAVKVHPNIEMD